MTAIIILITVLATYQVIKLARKVVYSETSFKNTLDLTDLPIIKCSQGLMDFNFIVDSGASNSILTEGSLNKLLVGSTTSSSMDIIGHSGVTVPSSKMVSALFDFGTTKAKVNLQIIDMKDALNAVSLEAGEPIDGILGSDFLSANEAIVNYIDKSLLIKRRR